MRELLFKKGLVAGIILLFIGTGIIPNISGNIGYKSSINNIINIENKDLIPECAVTSYNSDSPGLIIAIGQGSINTGTHHFAFDLGILAFIGYNGGGPSFIHTSRQYTHTEGWYTFLGPTLVLNPGPPDVFMIAILWPNATTPPHGGRIIGNSYP